MDTKYMGTPKVSAVIIAKNEEKMIGDCLESLIWADEIVVIDTGSTDNTSEIAKKYQARVVTYTSGKNFADWRNKGKQEAKGAWILYLDGDERVTPMLRSEIKAAVESPKHISAYAIPRRNFILGHEFKHCGQYPDYQIRFFAKENLLEWTGDVHEKPKFVGSLGHFKNPMIHEKHETVSEMIVKTNKWSEYEAKLMFEAHHPPMTIPRFISAMAREFVLRMIKQVAFLDGPMGIMYGQYQVFSRLVSYAKLWEMQQKGEHSK